MNEHAENWANLHKSSLSRLSLKIQFSLFRSQFAQQCAFNCRSTQQRVRAQQHGGIGQQRHAPRQPQTIEKHLSQSELVFLVRLSGFNPRSDLLQQSLSGPRVQGQQSKQGFMSGRCVGKLSGAGAGFPANGAEWCRRHCSKPMQVVAHIVAEPLQRLALGTGRLSLALERGNHFHVRAHMRHDGDVPAFSTQAFPFGRQITHVGDDLARPPRPALVAIMETGNEQAAFGNIGWRHPTDHRHQQHRG